MKVTNLPEIDSSYLNLDYNNLNFDNEFFDTLESDEYKQGEPMTHTFKKWVGKGI